MILGPVHRDALPLNGVPFERGKAQANHADRDKVTSAIELRLQQNAAIFSNPTVQDYLGRQWEFASEHCCEEVEELNGIADGFDMEAKRLFEFLHLGIVKNLNMPIVGEDGCSTWAVSQLAQGPVVGKNRDFMGEHATLQAVFEHQDPSWESGRRILCIGSMGSPGAYSSGINSDGLTVVDTHISTSDYGVGWLRYFLMTRLLTHHSNVASAVNYIKSVPHAGGGSLILSDPTGRVAAVDLGHNSISVVERRNGWVARTNHFEEGSVSNHDDGAPMQGSTMGRRKALTKALTAKDKTLTSLTQLMQTHTNDEIEGLCRHGEDGDARTLSSAIFLCESRTVFFSDGNPCTTGWEEYSL